MISIYISQARVLAKAYAKETGKLLVRCLVPKRQFDWSSTFTLDISATGKLAETMRDNLTAFQEISFFSETEYKELIQGRILKITRITFGSHKGLQRTVQKLFTDPETGVWTANSDSREIEQEILRNFRANKYDPTSEMHNDTRIVDTEDEALEYLYDKYDISPNVIGAKLWKKKDHMKPSYDILNRM